MTQENDNPPCPFCSLIENDAEDRITAQNMLAVAISDGFPLSDGHTVIVPRRHVGSFFELTQDERDAMFALLELTKLLLDGKYTPDSYNIGINDGPMAGQTIPHCHMHLIPRYTGDVEDPRGGVRWVLSDKAKYWTD
ncbi:MAG: HIT family protein [Gammaproteobacteria bacterium]|nr:HIT family protein [Gammaproteobacteria bacterium]